MKMFFQKCMWENDKHFQRVFKTNAYKLSSLKKKTPYLKHCSPSPGTPTGKTKDLCTSQVMDITESRSCHVS